ncbi:sulfurtransferase [Thalassospira sp. HJ]|uniref:rhodanese-like domain-containing protein n=1 Tax=Thalassospira sp. HJ TaxID=1616823 RepID=UPI0005EA29FD|nr:rhodanese-like domain-containing protein [Thalassospira sp. HJ]KJE34959.1 sulfurtransferase [Thalassospira sp. HJ]
MSEGAVKFLESHELDLLIGQVSVTVIDVREPDEFAKGHIETSINIPTSNFDIPAIVDITDEADTDLVFVCSVGQRSFGAANAVLAHVDCEVSNLKGGIQSWCRAGFDLEGEAQ